MNKRSHEYTNRNTYINGIIGRASHSLSSVVLEDEGFVCILALRKEGTGFRVLDLMLDNDHFEYEGYPHSVT